jgi:hypothetical protein
MLYIGWGREGGEIITESSKNIELNLDPGSTTLYKVDPIITKPE